MNTKPGTRIFVLFGPESTGKTTLALQLAVHFRAPLITEFMRSFCEREGRLPLESDMLDILTGQWEMEKTARVDSPSLLFTDTDPLQVLVYQKMYFGQVPDAMEDIITRLSPRHYLLTGTDIPWVADPMRDRPDDRSLQYDLFRRELLSRSLSFTEISGDTEARRMTAMGVIRSQLQSGNPDSALIM